MPPSKAAPVLGELTNYIDGLTGRRRDLMHERAGLQERREKLLAMPLGRADVRELTLALVDKQAEFFAQRGEVEKFIRAVAAPSNAQAIDREDRGAVTMRDYELARESGAAGLQKVFGVLNVPSPFGDVSHLILLTQALAYFFGDLVKAKVAVEFDRLHGPADGVADGLLSLDARRSEIGAIASRIGEIDAEVANIDGELAQVRSAAAVQTDEERRKAREVAQIAEYREKYRQIYARYNGKNAEEVAKRYGVSVGLVQTIGKRGMGEITEADAMRDLQIS